ncbi:FKBP-type peptidyl-prolyl cis-trans isomerase [Stakelama marina]|uniref:Peptidyl-prolyl cis-trans isomerase n=1 Tax=Stakelama marina TaxID=2826939 RepID=A0A8T4IPA2_9SPHN|nr:FKBP-type peptidyl-prolyl cis-trans isomerase [Stakelama marina]MBR0553926.1 FKBP-type peptidyl-prolyl cis-trans isomerase [Stakelama marina]
MSVTAVPIQPVKRSYLVWLWLGVIVAVAAALLLAWRGTAETIATQGSDAQFLAWHAKQPGVETTPSGLQYKVLQKGEGAHPTDDDVALINYTGKLRDGTVFDQSQQPTPMPVNGVIPGFSEGMKLMSKGAKYRFWIPADQAYGSKSPDPNTIPNDAMLVFDVELLEFIPQQMYQRMMQMQMQGGMPGGAGAAPGGAPNQ